MDEEFPVGHPHAAFQPGFSMIRPWLALKPHCQPGDIVPVCVPLCPQAETAHNPAWLKVPMSIDKRNISNLSVIPG